MAAQTVTPKQIAQELGTDAKSLRKFLREYFPTKNLETPGQGGRYAITLTQAKAIKKAFASRPVREVKVAEADEVEDISEDEEILDLDEVTETDEVETV